MHITNYPEIREALNLILEKEAPDKKEKILDSLDDAMTNNCEYLCLTSEINEFK